ncbi:unnamed protein product, partial [Closterium sp. NIES-64]
MIRLTGLLTQAGGLVARMKEEDDEEEEQKEQQQQEREEEQQEQQQRHGLHQRKHDVCLKMRAATFEEPQSLKMRAATGGERFREGKGGQRQEEMQICGGRGGSRGANAAPRGEEGAARRALARGEEGGSVVGPAARGEEGAARGAVAWGEDMVLLKAWVAVPRGEGGTREEARVPAEKWGDRGETRVRVGRGERGGGIC